jgi:hypothetical protein
MRVVPGPSSDEGGGSDTFRGNNPEEGFMGVFGMNSAKFNNWNGKNKTGNIGQSLVREEFYL